MARARVPWRTVIVVLLAVGQNSRFARGGTTNTPISAVKTLSRVVFQFEGCGCRIAHEETNLVLRSGNAFVTDIEQDTCSVLADVIISLEENRTIQDVGNRLKEENTRRKEGRKSRSTSSDSAVRSGSDGSADTLSLTMSSSSSSDETHNRYKPVSTEERKGWRKWHRKCPRCPEDMIKKWRDRTINWICGGYQRARRSFKSECMMHYRNCQDGTMFVKVHDHRCQNDTGKQMLHGLHFFYDYGRDSQDSRASMSMSSSSVDSFEA